MLHRISAFFLSSLHLFSLVSGEIPTRRTDGSCSRNATYSSLRRNTTAGIKTSLNHFYPRPRSPSQHIPTNAAESQVQKTYNVKYDRPFVMAITSCMSHAVRPGANRLQDLGGAGNLQTIEYSVRCCSQSQQTTCEDGK